MKTPEQIKNGLRFCVDQSTCEWCSHNDECDRKANALEYIEKLEAENKRYHLENTEMYAEMCMLREKVHRLEAQVPKWISVEERLPIPLQYVLVINQYDDDSFEPLVAYNRAGQWFTGSFMGGEVAHWMPLPEPPKEGAK